MCCMCECENGKTNLSYLSHWELVLPPLGPCQSSWTLHGRHQEPGRGCALGNAPLGRCWCSVCAAAPLSILQLSSSIKANACSAFCIKANACSAFCCPGRAHLCQVQLPRAPCQATGSCSCSQSHRGALALPAQPSLPSHSASPFPWSWKSSPFHRVFPSLFSLPLPFTCLMIFAPSLILLLLPLLLALSGFAWLCFTEAFTVRRIK